MSDGRLTEPEHWDAIYAATGARIRLRLSSPLAVDTRNFARLVRPHVGRGARVLELGCAPGKQLAWLGSKLGARVSGIDYAPAGIAATRRLLGALGVDAELRCEDFFAPSFAPGSFDLVYSLGVIEHFADPRALVRTHLELVAPGGVALVVIPNYGGVYGWLQRRFNPDNLALHNLDIMSRPALARLAPDLPGVRVKTYALGRASTGLISWERHLPPAAVRALHVAGTAAALLQPVDVRALSPWLVLELARG